MDLSKIKLIAMDLDGTLTQHKTKLEDFNKNALDTLKERFKLLIIGAGSCRRIFEQLDGYPIEIIGNYGMQYSTVKNGKFTIKKDEIVPVDKKDIVNRINRLRAKFGFNNYTGETAEFHPSGMITFPILGTKALMKDKLKYDPTRQKRRAIYNEVKEAFSEYTVFVGGTSSFDIAPPPYNKLYALKEYIKWHNLKPDNVVYIGDDYGIGGNDWQIYNSEIDFICIDHYKDFPGLSQKLYERID